MRVSIVLEFPAIADANGPEADAVIDNLAEACEILRQQYDAASVWIDDAEGVARHD
jgi:hypothetical protein